jgi:hypothetical protein
VTKKKRGGGGAHLAIQSQSFSTSCMSHTQVVIAPWENMMILFNDTLKSSSPPFFFFFFSLQYCFLACSCGIARLDLSLNC